MKLSIIMPCYNCVATLEEALASIGDQHFTFPYEVIMVNDGSTDGTLDLIISLVKKYSLKYPNIRYISHDKNRGGGAARNTGIAASTGELIYCLDSDNILAPGSLETMAHFLDQKKADGVLFHERRFFSPRDITDGKVTKFKSHFNTILDRKVEFTDLWNGSNTILDNFLYTRASYDKTGGYPTEHGFDTQAFELEYLSKNSSVWVCPKTIFYHRQNMKEKSYFERVYANGELSVNYYLAMEKIIDKFSPEAADLMMRYDIFGNASIYSENLKSALDEMYRKNPDAFFAETPAHSPFLDAVRAYSNHDYQKAMDLYKKIIAESGAFPLVEFNLVRAEEGLKGLPHDSLTKAAYKRIGPAKLKKQHDLYPSMALGHRILRKAKKESTKLFNKIKKNPNDSSKNISNISKQNSNVKKRIIILEHSGGRLGNQLWNFMGVWAYGKERGYEVLNYSFDYYPLFRMEPPNSMLKFLSSPEAKKNKFVVSLRPYRRYINFIKKFFPKKIADSGEVYPYYLPPTPFRTAEQREQITGFEQNSDKTLYTINWMFRNPVALKKYHREAVEYFRPNAAIERNVVGLMSEARKKYSHIVGVHIRQGDYKHLSERAGVYFEQKEIPKIFDEYLAFSNHAKQETLFIICSDEAIEESHFKNFNVRLGLGGIGEDLFTLSATDCILGSDSTFGAFASYYGDIPLIVFAKPKIDWDFYRQKMSENSGFFENEKTIVVGY